MAKKITVASDVMIDLLERRYNNQRRLPMQAVPSLVWYYVVFLSLLFTVTEGKISSNGVGIRDSSIIMPLWKNVPSFLSRNSRSIVSEGLNNALDELAIVVPSSSARTHSTLLFDTSNRFSSLRGGAAAAALNPFPSGYNPFGYRLTDFGKEYLDFEGSLNSDVGRFLSTLKGGQRKTAAVMKEQWLEIVRVSKKGQSMRIYRTLDDFIEFCLKAGFID
mmetsp:Transcript_16042/g.29085  ORF Transcript_16042/g.29085 Transcript_16042/m.29085 type:complete len:219 (+) Transcript_16042:152-808(+)